MKSPCLSSGHRVFPTILVGAVLGAALMLCPAWRSADAAAQAPQWIWSPEHRQQHVPPSVCHFRKSFDIATPEKGQITIAADDRYELYVNGSRVGSGGGWKTMDSYDITRHLGRGRNLIAVKVTNNRGNTAGLVARVTVQQRGAGQTTIVSDATWKTNLHPLAFWQMPPYRDARWVTAQSFGPIGRTEPWIDPEAVAGGAEKGRFTMPKNFEVQQVVDGQETGSLVAMTFNEFGQIIASREGGPLLLITDSDKNDVPDKVHVYCDKVNDCRGILALNGDVFAVGNGPEGPALYRLARNEQTGRLDVAATLIRFRGEINDYGPQGLVLGADGYIYVTVGGFSAPEAEYSPTSPYRRSYEGDLVQPRLEDPGAHAAGVEAPGGVVLRTDTEGSAIELVAGGLRNAPDLAVNDAGDMFVHDSAMYWDEGTPWYRPARVCHVTAGAEFGWRSGWAKWPDYYLDSLPATVGTGRGKPTGMVVYDHFMFPRQYQGAMFVCDWSHGKIFALTMKPSGAGYVATSEVFLEGEPLNATDLEVGPDGGLYFSTGGHGTPGGIYRVVWKGRVAEAVRNLGTGVAAAIRQPQLHSAWARQRIAKIKTDAGPKWSRSVPAVATIAANPPQYRTRALDLLQLFGPPPSKSLLLELSKDDVPEVRRKTAELMGLTTDPEFEQRLVAMLADEDATVRRKACESLLRTGATAPVDELTPLLISTDRFEAWAARRLLERIDEDRWRDRIFATDDHRLFVQGATALLIEHGDKASALAVLDRIRVFMRGFVSDRDFIDMLRVMQLAMIRGHVTGEDAPGLSSELAEEFPAGNATMNRELVRLLTYLQEASIADRYLAYLKSPDVADMEKLHLALYVGLLPEGLSTENKLDLFRFLQRASTFQGGDSLKGYVRHVTTTLADTLTEPEQRRVLTEGADMPAAALTVLYKLPKQPGEAVLEQLKTLDRQLAAADGDSAARFRVGVVAVLARSGDPASMAYLRHVYDNEPQRRPAVAIGLAQSPDGENWSYLVRSLPILEGVAARTVLEALVGVDRAPENPEDLRQVILQGLRMKDEGGRQAVALLEHWTGQQLSEDDDPPEEALATWQAWFQREYSDQPNAALPADSGQDTYSPSQLLEYLGSDEAVAASPARGALVFEKAGCAACHRFGDRGETAGPNLSNVTSRLDNRQILESILYPSQVIAKGYGTKRILRKDGRVVAGIVVPGGPGEISVLQSSGRKKAILQEEISEITDSKVSTMPEGRLNHLMPKEIAELFAYLRTLPPSKVTRRPHAGALR